MDLKILDRKVCRNIFSDSASVSNGSFTKTEVGSFIQSL